jgi:Pyridoxal-dependent decarboxylase conserved domain
MGLPDTAVQSINASGHKYGLVYPNLGWVIWRDTSALPTDLVLDVDYLGGTAATFALNFSRSGAEVVGEAGLGTLDEGAVVDLLTGIQSRYHEITDDRAPITKLLTHGADRARAIAAK